MTLNTQNTPLSGTQKKLPPQGLLGDLLEGAALNNRPYLPPEDLVGGAVPFVPGSEDEMVWNAAAQALGTERVHYAYTVNEGRCWYLATASSALSDNPDTWCPLAAALPGNSEYWDKGSTYIYEQDGVAGALRWDKETGRMQVFLGAARTLLPRLQSLESNFVAINPETARIAPWRSMALNRERLSRAMARWFFVSGLAITFVCAVVWLMAYAYTTAASPKLNKAREASAAATNQLMLDATDALQSNTDQALARIVELLNTMSGFGGVLTRFEIKADGKMEWEALIPGAVQPSQLQATALGVENGRVRIRGTN